MEPEKTEIELVKLLQSGDEAAYAQLYDRYASLLFGVLVRIVGEREDAENLLQDCFVKIWQHVDRFDPEKGRLATWLINIARNTAIDFTRSKYFSQKRQIQPLENFVHKEPGSVSTGLPVDTLGLWQLVKQLTPACREVIEWMYFEGYTQQEIADRFGIPLGTVKTRTRIALKELRTFFS
ncbi:MAG: ECF RNA polymerase sigma factor RpoE [Haliscomenobacter sp.]|jgi:RNA polymerase sigma-70 factor (ECF subfamily)|nr:ECF RNA polymerase sigma factor RpoE [Haliscomenobacter sp.]